MYSVENKFEIGEECYSVYRKPTHYKCPICEGNGKFKYNGYEICVKIVAVQVNYIIQNSL